MTEISVEALAQPFAQSAFTLCQMGLAVLPCPGSGGKSPKGAVAGFHRWRHPQSKAALQNMVLRWGSANIGVITGPASGVTVVDVDDGPELVEEMLRLFGDTPLISQTPSGGRHLWYRYNGEPNANLRYRHNLKVDIKAKSGVVIVPPSRNLSTGVPYIFARGSFDNLSSLPTIQARGMELLSSLRKVTSPREAIRPDLTIGKRNDGLFKLGLRHALRSANQEQLVIMLAGENANAEMPLAEDEVSEIARSAWAYTCAGDNWVGHGPRMQVTERLLQSLADPITGPEALWLCCRLAMAHGAKPAGQKFAVAAEAMANGPLMPLSARSIRRALGVLVRINVLERISTGGKGPGDPAQYVWAHRDN